MLNCREASQVVSQSLDRRLSLRERFGLRLHLMMCDACRQFVAQLRLLTAALKQQSRRDEQDESVKLSDSARLAIREKLHQH